MQVSVDISTASDKRRLRPTVKIQPVPLFLWFLPTQRGTLGGAPERSGGGKPQPIWCHSLGPVSRLRGQERLETGRVQPSSPAGIPHSALPRTMGRLSNRDMGDNRQPHGRNTTGSQGFICFKRSTSQVFTSHSRNTLGGWSCSSALSTAMALKCCKRCCARQAALLQVHCVPYGDAETGPELRSDPANSRDCWIMPPNPAEQRWGVWGEDEEIKHAINVCRIKLDYL